MKLRKPETVYLIGTMMGVLFTQIIVTFHIVLAIILVIILNALALVYIGKYARINTKVKVDIKGGK